MLVGHEQVDAFGAAFHRNAHADDHSEGDGHVPGGPAHPELPPRAADAGRTYAAASTEAVPLDRVTAVVLTHVVDRPERYRPGGLPREVTLGVAWGIARA